MPEHDLSTFQTMEQILLSENENQRLKCDDDCIPPASNLALDVDLLEGRPSLVNHVAHFPCQ